MFYNNAEQAIFGRAAIGGHGRPHGRPRVANSSKGAATGVRHICGSFAWPGVAQGRGRCGTLIGKQVQTLIRKQNPNINRKRVQNINIISGLSAVLKTMMESYPRIVI